MERINPPSVDFVAMRNGELQFSKGLSELGIFSYVISNNSAP